MFFCLVKFTSYKSVKVISSVKKIAIEINMQKIYEYIIIGGGIAGLAALARVKKTTNSVLLLESDSKCGGLIKSKKEKGYLLETGPSAFLKSYTHTMDLIKEYGLLDQVIMNRPYASKRYLYKDSAIHPIPENPFSFMKTPLFSAKAKMRLMAEPLILRGKKQEESIYDFGQRRFGTEITETVLDAMISGICAGDIKKLDIHSMFPRLTNIERTYRSLLLFLMKFKKDNVTETKSGEKTLFATIESGLGLLAETIVKQCHENVLTQKQVTQIEKSNSLYRIHSGAEIFYCENLIMATPAYVSAELLQGVSLELASILKSIEYVPMITVGAGYRRTQVKHLLDGFGYLVPRNQHKRVLGALFASGLFPGRSPVSKELLKIYIGGAHDKEVLSLSDQEILEYIKKEVHPVLKIDGDFDFVKINRIKNAIPQYNLGHQEKRLKIRNILAHDNSLFLVGNYLDGVSVNDSIKSSEIIMNNKKTPLMVQKDSYLIDQTDAILARMKKAKELELTLCGDSGSLHSFASAHHYYGMHKEKDCWVFREWAPNATAIFLAGEFSNWETKEEFRLNRLNAHGDWEIKLPLNRLKHLDYYKLFVFWNEGSGVRIPAYANYVEQDPTTYIFTARIWAPDYVYKFKNEKPIKNPGAPLIYEAHVGMSAIEGKVNSYGEFREKVLPRIHKAGYNTLQLMAIQEHPYYGSFGYQVSNFYASSSRCGTPDELKALIDEAHGLGMRVIMDIVHSHAVKNEVEGIAKFDGTQYQYFHDGGKGQHPAWDTMCFNYGKHEVIHFLLSNCRYWMEEFKFDGFRFDGVTSMLYWSHGLGQAFTTYWDYFNEGVDEDAVAYFNLANKLIHEINPDAITIAEDVSGMAGLASPIESGGQGFDYRLAMNIPDYWIKLLKESKDENWNMDHMYYELTNRRIDEKVISYAESHDQALVGDKTIIFWLIDKDMYWHMAKDRRNLLVDRGIALHKMIRMITITTARGGYLNFMGNEFGHPEWIDFPRIGNNWSYHYARRQWHLADDDNLCYEYLLKFDRAMIEIVKKYDLPNQDDPQKIVVHCDDHVVGFKRGDLLFVYNFDPERSYTDYAIFVDGNKYTQILNSDSSEFGGLNRLQTGQEHWVIKEKEVSKIMLYLPTRTVIVLKRE